MSTMRMMLLETRIRKTNGDKETRYHYNQKNQLSREENTESINYFTYDKQGGIVKERTSSGIRKFAYNSRHQQTRVETEDGIIQENRYDAEGLRYDLKENGKRTRFIYHNGELLYEREGKTIQSREETSYHLGAGIEALQRNQRTYYYHQDEQLNTALITNRNVEIKNQYQYDAFGNELEIIEELPNRIRYTGQQYDQQTKQYYLRARYYNPLLGRFMQEDVYQGDGLNLYTYCRNNPVMYYDPSGYACGELGKIAGDGNNSGEKSVSKKAMMLREGKNKTTVEVKSFAEADALLKEAFPDYQKVRGTGGSQQEKGIKDIRKQRKMDRYKKGGAYHKDYIMDKDKKIVYGHSNSPHGKYPHINIKRKDTKEVLINIVFKER